MKALLLLTFVAYTNAQWLSECGESKYPNPAPEQQTDRFGRVVGGWEARVNEFPYQISLREFGSHACGAVIVNEDWVLCAAHCTDGNARDYEVVAGEHYRSSPNAAVQVIPVLQIINHEFYEDPLEDSNDISLLRLANKIVFNENVRPACSPREVDYVDNTVTVSGWGTTFSGGSVTDELRYTNVQVQSNDDCALSYPGEIDESMICAAAPGRDTCQGDSGGPMAYNNNGKFEVVGLTSWGRGCAQPGFAGVYARVSAQLEWIKTNTQ
ncbi:DgyrCDS14139 [Dimorphilus gyrociliatus]|uniref:DgyrCDS14139 n=1 Tax=Dimorphilus gyrociliatus TaxID=2664684 RepID=A0A7I8WCR2_9ANNE|nr:DgyrCDS14139 [Dimorphilus gyrociliatus]